VPDPIARARAAAAVIAPLAARIEEGRRLPPEAVRALVDAGVFKLVVARELGGEEASATTLVSVIEEIARADGSAGWCAMIGASSALMSAFLDDATARDVYAPADAITCGVFAPMGRARREGDGLRVSGRWPFCSGCEHSQWRMGGVIVEGDPPLASGADDVRSVLFRADETRVVDTWNVSGLRGTGSHDIEARDVLVPSSRTFSLLSDRPQTRVRIHALPFFGVLAAGVASVTIGIARAAIDELVALAKGKRASGAKRTIAHRELVQLSVARAEAKVRAARALLRETIAEAEAEVSGGNAPSTKTRALLRLAAAHAASEAASAVDHAYDAAGASAIYDSSALQRCFRDVHVATQHVMVSATSSTMAGRVLLDVETDTSTL
jgi:alkylation response protein AidB-like acyl-CoA dehydrogenase